MEGDVPGERAAPCQEGWQWRPWARFLLASASLASLFHPPTPPFSFSSFRFALLPALRLLVSELGSVC